MYWAAAQQANDGIGYNALDPQMQHVVPASTNVIRKDISNFQAARVAAATLQTKRQV